jgi:NAD(P)H dehydrogenase (quinone)
LLSALDQTNGRASRLLAMIAILGASGKAGRATIEKLRAQGASVRAVVRQSSHIADLEALGCQIAFADLHDTDAISKAIAGATDLGGISVALLLQKPSGSRPHIVHAEGPRRYSAIDVAASLSEVSGRQIVAKAVPESDWIALLTRGGASESYA